MWAVALVGGLTALAVCAVGVVILGMFGIAALAKLLMGGEYRDDES